MHDPFRPEHREDLPLAMDADEIELPDDAADGRGGVLGHGDEHHGLGRSEQVCVLESAGALHWHRHGGAAEPVGVAGEADTEPVE
jgi:hypothetical protein